MYVCVREELIFASEPFRLYGYVYLLLCRSVEHADAPNNTEHTAILMDKIAIRVTS